MGLVAGLPSNGFPTIPVPAAAVIMPAAEILRSLGELVKTITLPPESTAKFVGPNRPAEVANPPSPLSVVPPFPAAVDIIAAEVTFLTL